jgi:hypothetical protein
MPFNRKYIPTTAVACIFFALNIWYRNMAHMHSKTLMNLISSTTGYAGSNAIIVHGTIYAAIFLLFLSITTPAPQLQYIIKIGREGTAKQYTGYVVKYSSMFAICFMVLSAIYLITIFDLAFLVKNLYFVGWVIELVALWIVYILIGEFYLLSYWISLNKPMSLLLTLLITVILSSTSVVWSYWSPYKMLDIFDRLYSSGLQPIMYLIEMCLSVMICYGLYLAGITILRKRDLLQ